MITATNISCCNATCPLVACHRESPNSFASTRPTKVVLSMKTTHNLFNILHLSIGFVARQQHRLESHSQKKPGTTPTGHADIWHCHSGRVAKF